MNLTEEQIKAERERFEAWAASQAYSTEGGNDSDGWYYASCATDAAWSAWKAATAAPTVAPAAQPAETEAWMIRMPDGRRFIHSHNAIGDYREIEPGATVVELVRRAPADPPVALRQQPEAVGQDPRDAAIEELARENARLTREAWTWSKACESATLQLQALSTQHQWSPIETAPKGVKSLLFNRRIIVDDWGDYDVHNQPKFTHWMPLPPPPQSAPGCSQDARSDGASS